MQPDAKVTVWISDTDARTFLGLNPPEKDAKFNDRWFIEGEYKRDEPPAGFWMRVKSVSRWSAMGPVESRTVKPADCFIPWRYVLTIQPGGGEAFAVEELRS